MNYPGCIPAVHEHNMNIMKPDLQEKLAILSDAAKYDASCASSGTSRRSSRDGKGLGSTEGSGICHAYAPDGRCISLLKILMTNFCIYDCAYCINRVSSNVKRARFSVAEVVWLTTEFYRRNYIEGLFLSSGVIRSPDDTMAAMVEIARVLREEHSFRGYIHLKTIPDAAPELIEAAGRHADRLSINVELPTDAAVRDLAPGKSGDDPGRDGGRAAQGRGIRGAHAARPAQRRFAPAGQSTQMIVGADGSTDATIMAGSARLYSGYGLKRVYYSAFSPNPDASAVLPPVRPPLMREHRLYQADRLMRLTGSRRRNWARRRGTGCWIWRSIPKLASALGNRGVFPVDVNRADRETLLRVPGFGTKTVGRILATRRHRTLRYRDLMAMGAVTQKARPFVVVCDWRPGGLTDEVGLRARFAPPPEQLSLF